MLRCRGLHMSKNEMAYEFAERGAALLKSSTWIAGARRLFPGRIFFDRWHDWLSGRDADEPHFSGRKESTRCWPPSTPPSSSLDRPAPFCQSPNDEALSCCLRGASEMTFIVDCQSHIFPREYAELLTRNTQFSLRASGRRWRLPGRL